MDLKDGGSNAVSYYEKKTARREKKRTNKRATTGDEVIFIFEKILEGWKTIRIYNTLIQMNPKSEVCKKKVEVISSGNCKVYASELDTKERFDYYLQLREKVYQYHVESESSIEKIEQQLPFLP
jgi:ASC-1-like (ASCH) protein